MKGIIKRKNAREKRKRLFGLLVFLSFVFILTFNIYYSYAADDVGINSGQMAEKLQGTSPNISSFNPIVRGFLAVINLLLHAVLVVVSIIMLLAGVVMNWAVDPDNFLMVVDSQAVLNGWRTVRDMLNLAFIFVLLFSAFCTIFQVEKYHLKKILLTLVIMALLVNFSFPIARFIIDASNVMMYYFINTFFPNADANGISAKIAWAMNINDVISPDIKSAGSNPWRLTIMLIATIIFTFLFAITLLVISMLLVIRIVVLAILVIFAPVGFVAAIFPGTKNFSDSWWNQLFKQSFFGPVMIFMLSLAVQLMNEINSNNQFAGSIKKGVVGGDFNDYSTLVATGALMTVPIAILWAGLIAAQKIGAAGAGAIVGQASKTAKWAGATLSGYRAGKWLVTKAAPYGVKAGLKKFDRDVLAKKGLSPRAFVEGWKQRSAEVEERAMKPAAGVWRDRLNRVMGKEKTTYGLAAVQSNILKKQRELSDVSGESTYLLQEYKNAKNVGDYQKMSAILRIMFQNNDQNEFMKGLGKKVEPGEMKKFINSDLISAGMDEQEATKQMMDLSEIAFAKGNYGNYGMAMYDANLHGEGKGGFRLTEDSEQRDFAAAKIKNIESQAKFRNFHWNSFLVEEKVLDASGKPVTHAGELHEMGKNLLNTITSADIKQVHRARTDFLDNMSSRMKDIRDYATSLRSTGDEEKIAQAQVIDNFANEIRDQKGKKVEPVSGAEAEELAE